MSGFCHIGEAGPQCDHKAVQKNADKRQNQNIRNHERRVEQPKNRLRFIEQLVFVVVNRNISPIWPRQRNQESLNLKRWSTMFQSTCCAGLLVGVYDARWEYGFCISESFTVSQTVDFLSLSFSPLTCGAIPYKTLLFLGSEEGRTFTKHHFVNGIVKIWPTIVLANNWCFFSFSSIVKKTDV